jgi:hypothetical protein
MSREIQHLGLQDSTGCGIDRDLQVCMEQIRSAISTSEDWFVYSISAVKLSSQIRQVSIC